MPSIYNNIVETECLLDHCYDLETGEVDEAKEAELLALKEQLINEGLEKLCNLRADKLAYIAGLKAEATRMADKAKAEEKKLSSLEDYIMLIHKKSGEKKALPEAGQSASWKPSAYKPAMTLTTGDILSSKPPNNRIRPP